MLKRTALLMGLMISGFLSSPVMGAPSVVTRDLEIGGNKMLFLDSDQSGCGGGTDAECSAQVMFTDGMAAGSPLIVKCDQGAQSSCDVVPGAQGMKQYNFLIDSFDMTAMTGAVHQTIGGNNTSPNNFVSGQFLVQQEGGAPVGIVSVFDKAGASTGYLCSINGQPATEVMPAQGPTFLRNLDFVNCPSGCSGPCIPDPTTPNFISTLIPVPTNCGPPKLVLRNLYIPIMNKMLLFSINNPETALGQLDLTTLGVCPARRSPSPSMTNGGLMLAALLLLAAGSWVLGRRQAFAQSLPLP